MIVALLSGCASLGLERPAAEAAVSEAAAAEAGSRLPAPVLADESLERWGEAKAKRYGDYLSRSVLPLLAAHITHIKRKGYVDSVGGYVDSVAPGGLDHVHVRYRLSPSAGTGVHVLEPGGWDHLHYHGVEDLPGAVAAWRGALIEVSSGEMKRRLAENRRAQFDYELFFYGGGSYTPPPAIPPAVLKSYARRWWKQSALPGDRPTDARYRMLTDRLTLVIGGEQPGYAAAASRILAAGSLVAHRGSSVPLPTEQRFLDGHYHPVTIYFGRGRSYPYSVYIPRGMQSRGAQLETR